MVKIIMEKVMHRMGGFERSEMVDGTSEGMARVNVRGSSEAIVNEISLTKGSFRYGYHIRNFWW
jgi:hypothetical protein